MKDERFQGREYLIDEESNTKSASLARQMQEAKRIVEEGVACSCAHLLRKRKSLCLLSALLIGAPLLALAPVRIPSTSVNNIQEASRPKEGTAAPSEILRHHVSSSSAPTNGSGVEGSCSEEAWLLGPHQKIVSISFLNKNPGYSNGIKELVTSIESFYPEFLLRIYANEEDINFLQVLLGTQRIVFYCDISRIPPPIKTLSPYPVTMWRFAPMADPQVDVLLVRDSDSRILQREVDSVQEWLVRSNKTLHVMRDHPDHNTMILGGMWGLRLTEGNRGKLRLLRRNVFKRGYKNENTKIDQPALDIVWKNFQGDLIAHDSFNCMKYPGSTPWPTQRQGKMFVGAAIFRAKEPEKEGIPKECPKDCRPKEHQDWKYC